MAIRPFALLAGVLSLLLLPAAPPWPVPAAVGVALLVLAVLRWRFRKTGGVSGEPRADANACKWRDPQCGLLWIDSAIWAGGGFLLAAAHTHAYLAARWPAELADQRVLVEAIVEDIPVPVSDGWRFDASACVQSPQSWQRELRVRVVSRDPQVRPRAGERWQLLLSLQPPVGRLNPGGVDPELQLFRERIHAVGRVVPARLNRRMDAGHRPLAALRERVVERIETRVADRDAAALISALAVGATGSMSREQWRVFNATGTTHLVAISGLHVTLFAIVAFAIARGVWVVLVWRCGSWTRDGFAALFGLSAATGYALLAGFSVPTQRTLVMLAAWMLARLSARQCRPLTPLGIALAGVLMLDPFAPLFAGFWLSFAAMAVILFVTKARIAAGSRLAEAIHVQAAVTLVLAPLTFAWFESTSLIGPLANALAIPAIGWVFVPLVLACVALMPWAPGASDALLGLAEQLHAAAWPTLVSLANLPYAVAYAHPHFAWYVAAAFAVVLAIMPWPVITRVGAIAIVAPVAASGAPLPPMSGLSVTVLDVGQGTAVVVRTARHVLVYDTGEAYGSAGRVVDATLIPYLRSQGIRSIDWLVVSWPTGSGAAGVSALVSQFPVGQILVGGHAHADFPGARRCTAGDAWQVDAVVFEVLHPHSATSISGAAASCVLRIRSPGGRLLLTGDIDASAERELVQLAPVQAEVVVVPRHGAAAASSTQLVEAVQARLAIVSSRRASPTGDGPAIARWRATGARVLATGKEGAIRLEFDPVRGLLPERTERAGRRAMWRGSP